MNYLRRVLLVLTVVFCFTGPAFSQQPRSPLFDSFKTHMAMKRDTLFGVEWIGLGPVLNSARVEAVQADPSRIGVIYAAFGSGNLWKTINNGVTWRPLFENQASHGIGDFALAPSDPSIIYLGTGESLKKARNFTLPGTGIYRSSDGGESWRHVGLSDSWHIGEISVHPENPDVVVVAVLGHFWSSNPNRGLYRTIDGGKTWSHVLFVDEKTGANDVVWSKDDTNVVYASTWENYPKVSGSNSTVYRSDDAGATWLKRAEGLPTGEQIGRIGLAVSQANSNKVYALVDNRERIGAEGAAQVFQSLDGGKKWNQTHESNLMFFSRIGWYFADLYVNPKDDDEIFGLGVRAAHSVDGGKSFELLGGNVAHLVPSAASGLHLDHCEMWINPKIPNHILLGSDGGLYQSFDKGKNWTHFNNIPTGEFYDIELSRGSPYTIYAGAQDNATVYGPATEWNGTEQWKYLWIDPWNGGDGCVTKVDPSDSNTVYHSAQEGAFRRKDMKTNRSVGIRPPQALKKDLEFNFVAPMIISPHDHKTLFLAGNYVFKSTNRGDDWKVISPNLAISSDERRHSTAVAAIAESTIEAGLIYAGTDMGDFWVSENGGGKWDERFAQLPVAYIRKVYPSRHSKSRVYVALTGLNHDDLDCHVYVSENRGGSWSSIINNLPNEPANVIVEDPVHEDILYAGLFRGVYISMNRGKTWSAMGRNMPACSISDLEIHEGENDLIVATHGRGIYKVNLDLIHESFLQQLTTNPKDYLFPIPTAKRPYISDTRTGMNFGPVEKTPISFWVRDSGNVTFAVIDSRGKKVASLEREATRGFNQFRWDLVTNATESPLPYFIRYKQYLKPGNYRVQMETGHKSQSTQPLRVIERLRPNTE